MALPGPSSPTMEGAWRRKATLACAGKLRCELHVSVSAHTLTLGTGKFASSFFLIVIFLIYVLIFILKPLEKEV